MAGAPLVVVAVADETVTAGPLVVAVAVAVAGVLPVADDVEPVVPVRKQAQKSSHDLTQHDDSRFSERLERLQNNCRLARRLQS